MIRTLLCRYGALEYNLNEIHKDNIISIIQGTDNNGVIIYTVIYLLPNHRYDLKGVIF